MHTYFAYIYLFSLVIAILTVISGCFAAFSKAILFKVFPKALRFFVIVCYIPNVFGVALITIAYAVVFIIYDTEEVAFIDVANALNAYLTQFVRTFFFIFALERIYATIYIEKHEISDKTWFFWILALLNFTIAALFITLINYGPIAADFIFEAYTYTVLGTHFVSCVVFAVLYYLNKRMYKLTAYRISLKQRHQIVKNLKVLHYVFPSILIYNLIAPFGSLINSIGLWLDLPALPISIFHIFHNLPHLIICLRLLFINLKRSKSSKVNSMMVVKDVLGQSIPKTFKADEYFKDLQQQWK